jgi:antitoxin VapB
MQEECAVGTAKVFMTGRSQAVRLPKAYRFDTDEVSIERQPDGSVLLRPKSMGLLGDRLWAALDGLPDDATFVRPDQGEPEVRDWLDQPAPAAPRPVVASRSANRGKRAGKK